MRPLRIELEGFSAYRDHTVVSFVDADLFALVGPTGSGKSSIIDAITFALYGSVARYQHTGAVAPVINAQSAEAKVRLDFEVDGKPYTAVRVVRRTKSGATTKEARLECGNHILAGDARSLDAAVVDLLGLTFEQFTKTVVLPQGEFAAFLHAKAAERQDLLVRLLDLGLYGDVAQAARTREKAAAAQVELIERQLAELGDVDPAEADAAEQRANALLQLVDAVRAQLADIDAIEAELTARNAERNALFAQKKLLHALEVPEAVKDYADERAHAADDVVLAERALAEARAKLDEANEALRNGPDQRQLDAYREAWARLDAVTPLLEQAEQTLAELEAQLAARDAEVAEREAVLTKAREEYEAALVRAGAAELRHALHEGEPCPVCEQIVTTLPTSPVERDVNAYKGAVDTANRGWNQANRARQKVLTEVAKQQEALATLVRERDMQTKRLERAPSRDEVERQLEAVLVLQGLVEDQTIAWRQAELVHKRATAALAGMDETERALRRQLTETRDQLAALEPPPPGGVDLLEDWLALANWADDAKDRVEELIDAVAQRENELRVKRDRLRAVVVDACAAHDIDGTQPRLLEVLNRAIARAEAEAERVRLAVAQAEKLRAEAEQRREERDVAHELANLLGARGFEQWLLEEALDQLVAGATDRLYTLSSGQFSLRRDDKGGFAVVDHRNADEVRTVKTLSGGETFLASLALALALSDNVAMLSSANAPKLESIFLDEGFGTLDPDTLDVVSGAIEELGATGRMVGLVTHIRDLADRLPVRFEVTKLGATSVIERIDT
ncbi:MAG TPA: SMC family ATPase [Acidimicrobiales bacterium]